MVIEAFQMTFERRLDNSDWPVWLSEAWNKRWTEPGALSCEDLPNSNGTDRLALHTLEGVQIVNFGDWIIRGVKGELYPCKPDIFEMTYEPAHPYGLAMGQGLDNRIYVPTATSYGTARAKKRDVSAEETNAAFDRVWEVVRRWDISTDPGPYGLYEGINGDHVRAIVAAALGSPPRTEEG